MVVGNRYKTIRWKFLESIEKPRVVHIRCTELLNKSNLYGQVTVRMHSKQVRFLFNPIKFDTLPRVMTGCHFRSEVIRTENFT